MVVQHAADVLLRGVLGGGIGISTLGRGTGMKREKERGALGSIGSRCRVRTDGFTFRIIHTWALASGTIVLVSYTFDRHSYS